MLLLDQLSDRAIIAYSIACAEWVVARFSRVSRDEHPLRFLEACWAFEMDRHLAAPPPNQDDEWKGSIRGALDMAMVTVLNTYYTTEDGVGEIEGAFNEKVVLHVLLDPQLFLVWRGTVLSRLHRLYPRDPANSWGDPVPREALDPRVQLESTDFGECVRLFLSSLSPATNPLLRRIEGDNSK